MKKAIIALLFIVLLASLTGCQKTLRGTDALIERAREELSSADADTIELQYAGLCSRDDDALIWFISGNEYQAHTYLPMECAIVGENEYTYTHTYSPMERGMDIAVVEWKGGYCFLVNNEKCCTIRITDNTGTRDENIEKDAYPYIFYNNLIPSEYLFLDAEGNEVP